MPPIEPARRGTAAPLLRGATSRIGESAGPAVPHAGAPRALHRQNGMGDVVVPVANGEIVALPRLWDFDLTELTADAGVLTTDTGLIAVVSLDGDTAVVTDVTDSCSRWTA